MAPWEMSLSRDLKEVAALTRIVSKTKQAQLETVACRRLCVSQKQGKEQVLRGAFTLN